VGFFNNIIFSLIASSSLVSGGDDGWFSVPSLGKGEEESTERDPSIWVLFSKTIDLEKILVRLPEDPVYKYTESGALEIRSESSGEIFELTVYKAGSLSPLARDSLYHSEGGWIHEHVVKTEHHVYVFRTTSNQADSPNHKNFISSFVNFPQSFR
jgi:hypothetical protein